MNVSQIINESTFLRKDTENKNPLSSRFQLPPLMQSNDPLHGKTLQAILETLVNHYGWEHLGEMIRIKCFTTDPSIKSSLTFLRKTPWARKKAEDLYLKNFSNIK